MSFFQKFESAYSSVIRLLTMLFTLGLLAGAVMVGVNWLRVTDQMSPDRQSSQASMPKVSADKVIGKVVAANSASADDSDNSNDGPPASATDGIDTDDPDYASYQRIDKTIGAFLRQHHIDDTQKVGDQIVGAVRQSASQQDTEALTHAYVSGAADTVERALATPALLSTLNLPGAPRSAALSHRGAAHVASAARATSATNAVSAQDEDGGSAAPDKPGTAADVDDLLASVVSQYDAEFTRQAEKSAKAAGGKNSGESRAQRLTDSMSILGRYVGLLILALLVLQALTFGRIEQSMRALAGALGASAPEKSGENTPLENGKSDLPAAPMNEIESDAENAGKAAPPASSEDKPAKREESAVSTDQTDAPSASGENEPPAEDKDESSAA